MQRRRGLVLVGGAAAAIIAACVGDDPAPPGGTTVIIVNDSGPTPTPTTTSTDTVPPEPPDSAAPDAGDGGADASNPMVDLIVFATSTTVPSAGNLGGVSEADKECQRRGASAATGGTFVFVAWLSSGGDPNALERLPPNGRWTNTHGELVATHADIANNGTLEHAIGYTETGAKVDTLLLAWTGTNSKGQRTTDSCNNWVNATGSFDGTYGNVTTTDGTWSDEGHDSCGSAGMRLICFQTKK